MQMQTQPKTSNKLLTTVMEPHMSEYQVKKGNKSETRYRVSLVLSDTEIPVYLTLPAMLTQFTEFSENGDAEKFGKNLGQLLGNYEDSTESADQDRHTYCAKWGYFASRSRSSFWYLRRGD